MVHKTFRVNPSRPKCSWHGNSPLSIQNRLGNVPQHFKGHIVGFADILIGLVVVVGHWSALGSFFRYRTYICLLTGGRVQALRAFDKCIAPAGYARQTLGRLVGPAQYGPASNSGFHPFTRHPDGASQPFARYWGDRRSRQQREWDRTPTYKDGGRMEESNPTGAPNGDVPLRRTHTNAKKQKKDFDLP